MTVIPNTCETKIERDGLWPFPWSWSVYRNHSGHPSMRSGMALTKDRAQRKAVRAQLSMERDDVFIIEVDN